VVEEAEATLPADRIFQIVRLSRPLERAFRDYEREHRRRETVFGLVLGVFFYVALLALSWMIAPDVYELDVAVRLGLGLPINLAMIGLVMRRTCGDATRQWAICTVGLVCSLGVSVVMALSVSPGAVIYLGANLIILGFSINMVAVSTGVAALICSVVTAIMVIAAAVSPFGDPGVVVSYAVLGILLTIVCVFANWSLQNERRRTFLTMRRDEIRLRQISQQRDLLERLAAVDPLTGLANRRGFDTMVEGDLARADAGAPVAVAMIDIDSFKAFNDGYGHPCGDAVLRAVARAMAASCEPGQRLGRLGGEEFALAAVGIDHAALPGLGERLRRAVEALALPHGRGGAGPVVTISLGIAGTWTTGAALDYAGLLARADEALYRAKRSGRNRVVVTVEGAPDRAVLGAVAVEAGARRAG
jgi:diguanylate cyclase (GGDEF)-like protein